MPKKVNDEAGLERLANGKWKARVFYKNDNWQATFVNKEQARRWRRKLLSDLERCPQGISFQRGLWVAVVESDSSVIEKKFPELDDAKIWLDKTQNSILAGTYVSEEVALLTFREFVSLWRETKVRAGDRTMMRYEVLLRNQILPYLGDKLVTRITQKEVQAWVAKLSKDAHGPASIAKAVALVKQILDKAFKEEIIARNPVSRVELPKVESSDKKALSVAEVEALARECGKYGTLVRFLAYLGPRIGEATALKVGDIDFVANEVRISRAWTINKDYERVISTTKTNSTREIPLPDAFVEELKDFVDGREQEDWLFAGESKGFALNYDYFRKAVFSPAAKKLGLKNVTIHTLRHTFASLAISTHSPITDVSNVLGHSSSQQTLDTYAHHYKRSVRKTMAAISTLITEETCKERAGEEESAA